MSYTEKLTDIQQNHLDVRILQIAQKYGTRILPDYSWIFENHQIFKMAWELINKEADKFIAEVLVSDEWQLVPKMHNGRAGLTDAMLREFYQAYDSLGNNNRGSFERLNAAYNALLRAAPKYEAACKGCTDFDVGMSAVGFEQSCPGCEERMEIAQGVRAHQQAEVDPLGPWISNRKDLEKRSEEVTLPLALIDRFTKWRLCMSYNDSYFGEPAGELKRIALEMSYAAKGVPTQAQQAAQKISQPVGVVGTGAMNLEIAGVILPVVGTGAMNLEGASGVNILIDDYNQALWQTGTPPVENGEYVYFNVAVRRAARELFPDEVFVFTAAYCNAYGDELYDQDGKEFIANGWYDIGHEADREYNTCFVPTLESGDEVVGWQPLPKWNGA